MVEILLDAGADVDHMDDISGTPLHGAARRNLSKCCRVLLNRGACVDAPDGVGNRPLHLAAAEGAMSALEVHSQLVRQWLFLENDEGCCEVSSVSIDFFRFA